MAMPIEAITNYIQVSDRLASSGQPEEHQFRYIAKAKYRLIINLAMPNSENAIPEEGYIVAALRMTYVHIPVPFEAPNVDHLKAFIRVMTAFSDQRVWVHCALNYRVSAFLYQYKRLVEGVTEEEAAAVMLRSWEPNEVWQRFMEIPGFGHLPA